MRTLALCGRAPLLSRIVVIGQGKGFEVGRIANISKEPSHLTVAHDRVTSTSPILKGFYVVYAVSPGVRSTGNEDGGIVLDIDRGEMFRLNPVGALILDSFRKGIAEREIARQIAIRYEIDPEAALADIHDFMSSLEEHKLIRADAEEEAS